MKFDRRDLLKIAASAAAGATVMRGAEKEGYIPAAAPCTDNPGRLSDALAALGKYVFLAPTKFRARPALDPDAASLTASTVLIAVFIYFSSPRGKLRPRERIHAMDVAVKAPVFTSQTRVTPELRSEVERVSDGLSTHQDVVELARRVAEEDGQSWDRHPLAGEVNTESGFLSFRSTRHRQGFWPLSLLKPDIEKFEIRAMDYRTKDEDGTPRHTTVYTKAAGRAVYTDSDLANRTVADGFLVTCGTVRTEDEGYGARTDHMHAEGAWPVDGTARPAAYQFHIDGVTNGRVTWDSRQTWEVKFDPSAAATPAQKAVSPKIQAMEETFQALSAAAREMEGEKAGRTGGGLLIEGEVPGFGAVKGEKDWEIGAHDASCLKLESDTASFSSSSGIRGERYFTIQDKATGFEQDLKLCGDGTVEYSESERLPRNERPEPEPFIVRGSKFEDDGSCGFGSGSSW